MKNRPKAMNIKPAQKSFGLLIFIIPSLPGKRACTPLPAPVSVTAHEYHGVSQYLILTA
jgi:hypothetical protein